MNDWLSTALDMPLFIWIRVYSLSIRENRLSPPVLNLMTSLKSRRSFFSDSFMYNSWYFWLFQKVVWSGGVLNRIWCVRDHPRRKNWALRIAEKLRIHVGLRVRVYVLCFLFFMTRIAYSTSNDSWEGSSQVFCLLGVLFRGFCASLSAWSKISWQCRQVWHRRSRGYKNCSAGTFQLFRLHVLFHSDSSWFQLNILCRMNRMNQPSTCVAFNQILVRAKKVPAQVQRIHQSCSFHSFSVPGTWCIDAHSNNKTLLNWLGHLEYYRKNLLENSEPCLLSKTVT